MELTVRCRNLKCGNWFTAIYKGSETHQYCSKPCQQEGVHYKRSLPGQGPNAFLCRYCGRSLQRVSKRQATCGSETCQKAHELRIKKDKRAGKYISTKVKNKKNPRAGTTLCLRCDKPFKSPDVTKIRFCHKCRISFQMAREEYRFHTHFMDTAQRW